VAELTIVVFAINIFEHFALVQHWLHYKLSSLVLDAWLYWFTAK